MAKNKKLKKAKIKPKVKSAEPADAVHKTRIRVIGIGGGGGSIVAEIAPQIKKVDFLVVNTDIQALKAIGKKTKTFQFGQALTKGLGCGMDPKVGKNAAEDAEQKIANLFKGVDLAILVSCLGGGTGSGSAPEFAKIAKEMGVMTFGIFTMPFKFEGIKRAQIAKVSLEKLKPNLNAFSVILNENIFKIINKDTPIIDAFSAVNKRLFENLRGLIEMIYCPGIVNIDFADLKTILDGRGKIAYLNSAIAQGQNRSEEAIKELLGSPLNEYGINGAEKILFNVTASKDLKMAEVESVSRTISDFNRRAKIIFGVSQDNNYSDKLRIALLAVGCGKEAEECEEEPEQPKKPLPKKKHKSRKKPLPPAKKEVKQDSKPKPKVKPKKKNSRSPIRVRVGKGRQASILVENGASERKNGLDLKKEAEKIEEKLFEEEKKWEVPAFLRRQAS